MIIIVRVQLLPVDFDHSSNGQNQSYLVLYMYLSMMHYIFKVTFRFYVIRVILWECFAIFSQYYYNALCRPLNLKIGLAELTASSCLIMCVLLIHYNINILYCLALNYFLRKKT